jgi:hypothetical protein
VGFEQLTLEDSTVTGNVSSGGTAGVNGEETDHLTLKNSIVYGNSGGADLGGFAGVGGSLAATYSDVCSGTAPLTGVGNICAAPQLASPSTGDVHETGSSPTIDAGSNPLVPSGLSTDVFGGERILAGHLGCTVENPKVVDIGADEFIPPVPPCVPMIVPPPFFPKPALASLVKLKLGPTSATLKITCKGTSTQSCTGKIVIRTAETLQGKKIVGLIARKHAAQSHTAITVAEAPFTVISGHTLTVQLKLDPTGLALFKRFHGLPGYLIATQALPPTQALQHESPFVFVLHSLRFIPPRKKHKQHHSKHH